ncbi:MAG TPA: outer membrane beta-barrel protein [Xanthobacteraceae bacterium]|nr:outer membrane beta-barrel protein [Xanthobacteraceae bacterium]
MRKRFIIGLSLLGSLAAGPALAADMALKAPPAPAVYNWQGFYGGGNIGYGWDPATATFNPTAFANAVLGPLGGPYVVTGSSGPVNLSVNPQGVLGGGQVGYNWQSGATVYGIEADFDGANINGSTSAPFFVNGTEGGDIADFAGNVGLAQKVDYFGTVRGRLGWANDNLLLYGTGGFAYGHVTTSLNTFGITAPPGEFSAAQLAALQVSASTSSLRPGFAVGGGIEWALARNWSIRAEYLFVDLASATGTLTIPGGSASLSYVPIQVVRFGFNYLFH